MEDKFKAVALLWMMPGDLQAEAYKKTKAQREDYNYVRNMIDEALYAHATGIRTGKPVNHIDKDGEDVDSDGEQEEVQWLNPVTNEMQVFTISKRDWEQIKQRRQSRNPKEKSGPGKDNKDTRKCCIYDIFKGVNDD